MATEDLAESCVHGSFLCDPDEKVVWLLAYGLHRSGEPEDAFPYFKQLDSEGRLLPTFDDYKALEKDRGRRFVEQATRVVPRLMEQARQHPDAEQSASIGGSAEIGVAMEVVETLEEVYLRVSPLTCGPPGLRSSSPPSSEVDHGRSPTGSLIGSPASTNFAFAAPRFDVTRRRPSGRVHARPGPGEHRM